MKKNTGVRLVSILVLGMILASACTQPYSQVPLATPTLISTGLFVSPFPSGEDPLQVVADLGTQTAMAKTEEAGGTTTPGTPGTPTETSAPGTPLTESPTPTFGTPVTVVVTTPAPVTVIPNGTTTTVVVPTISVNRPATYTLQSGEYPYCIARRFNLNPDDLLALNGITDGGFFYPGNTLTIPQSGSWPGERAWHSHPDTYTVSSSNTTIYSVACYYGDVYPEAIAQANNISLSTLLTVGQVLSIP